VSERGGPRKEPGTRGRALEREAFVEELHGAVDAPALHAALARLDENPPDPTPVLGDAAAGPAPLAFPGTNNLKWVPIGPTVTRRGQAIGRPRVSGRIRALAVDDSGRRAYAGSAKGGVWYTDDAGSTWRPVGGWAGRLVNTRGTGNMFSTGALLVHFGATAADDFVMVGTGEAVPGPGQVGAGAQGGVGVLAALGPVGAAVDADPWEPDAGAGPGAGAGQLAGVGVRRLVRHPAALSSPGATAGATQDRVLAATTHGLFLGTRAALPPVAAAPPANPGDPPQNALPARDGFTWAPYAGAPNAAGNDVTDVLWMVRVVGGTPRPVVVYAIAGQGVFISNDPTTPQVPIAALSAPAVNFNGRISLARVAGTDRVYVLGETNPGLRPSLFQVADIIGAPETVAVVPGVPSDLFGDPTDPPTQADYDQAIAVENVGGNDRIYLGGSTVWPRNTSDGDWVAGLYCFETPAPPAAVTALAAASGISRRRDPPTGDGADADGLVGNNVHPDVHAIVLTGPAPPNRHVWVGCDGGVFASVHGGRVNTFASRNTGLATLEPIFVGSHPTSSHFLIAGFQDNGSQVRVGDTMWEATFEGDGGGSLFHPTRSQVVLTQYVQADWQSAGHGGYRDPMTRRTSTGTVGRESSASNFYSGAAAVRDAATGGRVALGTNRVWLTDNLGTGTTTWRTLPFPAGSQRDARPGGTDPPARRAFGVPGFNNPGLTGDNRVVDMVWQSANDLLVMYRGGIVRYTNTNRASGTWTTRVWDLMSGAVALPANTRLAAVASVPGALDFYVATLGDAANPATETLWFLDDATNTFSATGFRTVLDFAGPPVVTGPLDPCYAVTVDPALPGDVYVGTATGAWKGRRNAGVWTFARLGNGLPDATVQDLDVWADPLPDPAVVADPTHRPRLLRAAVQSRGVWEVDISGPDPRHTYVRMHARDDRRVLPSPMANPRRNPAATPEVDWASPDIAVRPRWPVATPPRFRGNITFTTRPSYELWTFQTAFRWLYPSCEPTGRWSDAFRDLIRFHRSVLGLSASTVVDAALWRAVVGSAAPAVVGTTLRVDPADAARGVVTSDAADAPAVYRPPWHTTGNFTGHGTEVDLVESVHPVRRTGDEWTVYAEPCTVDVLLHHRDSRPVAPGAAFAALLWQSAPTAAALRALAPAGLDQYHRDVLAAGPGGAAPAAPAGWTQVLTPGGSAQHPLTTLLDARLPRAVSVDVDLAGVTAGHRVLVVALVGSGADDPPGMPVGAPATVGDLARAYRHVATRIVRVVARP
jgi:hypothetical protein